MRRVVVASVIVGAVSLVLCSGYSTGAPVRVGAAGIRRARASTTLYHITDLGTLGGPNGEAFGLNNSVTVVGRADTASQHVHAFRWSAATGMQDLGTLGGSTSAAFGLNDAGQVVGCADTASTWPQHAFLRSPSGAMQDLGTLGDDYSVGRDINSSGQVVGGAGDHAFLWSASGGMQSLWFGEAYGINASGQVVGWGGGPAEAVLWTAGGSMQYLGTLGGLYSGANDINGSGQVVGGADTGPGPEPFSAIRHAFLWSPAGGMQDLGVLGDSQYTEAYGINDSGQVVGWAFLNPPMYQSAFLWSASGGMQDLNDLLDAASASWVLRTANAINNAGQIVGQGVNPAGQTHAYLATPLGGQPDLIISALTVSPNPAALGAQVTLSVTEQNTGTAAAGAHRLSAWGNRGTAPAVGTNGDSNWDLPSLAVGASVMKTWSYKPGYVAPRTAQARADALGAVAESNEGNNTKSYAYSITAAAPDLIVQSLAVSPNPSTLGTQVTLTVTEQNVGTAAAGAHRLSAWGNRATAPAVGTSGDSNWDIASLAAGASETRTWSYTPGYAWPRTARARADALGAVAESNEGNNTASYAYVVNPVGGTSASGRPPRPRLE